MKITTLLFDLDGTLLPMDQEVFTKAYFGLLSKKMMPCGLQPEELVKGIWTGTMAMIKNDGKKTNEEVFWDTFCSIFGEDIRKHLPVFDEFYRNEFQTVKEYCKSNPKAKEVVSLAKEMGFRIALATNPIFPAIATESRIRWADLNQNDFELITTYENSSYCKPNPNYYLEILKKMKVKPEECLMIGNDVLEDGVVTELGMPFFLLTDCIINKDNKDYSNLPHGGFEELVAYLKGLAD